MLTVEKLQQLGADTQTGIKRCVDNEEFYLKMVRNALEEDSFERLKQAIENDDLKEAFDRAHAMKGVLGNLALDSLFAPVSEITEELRAEKEMDYTGQLDAIENVISQYRSLL